MHSDGERTGKISGMEGDSGPPRDRRSGAQYGARRHGTHRSARIFWTDVADFGATAGATRSA